MCVCFSFSIHRLNVAGTNLTIKYAVWMIEFTLSYPLENGVFFFFFFNRNSIKLISQQMRKIDFRMKYKFVAHNNTHIAMRCHFSSSIWIRWHWILQRNNFQLKLSLYSCSMCYQFFVGGGGLILSTIRCVYHRQPKINTSFELWNTFIAFGRSNFQKWITI